MTSVVRSPEVARIEQGGYRKGRKKHGEQEIGVDTSYDAHAGIIQQAATGLQGYLTRLADVLSCESQPS